jgi:hypothetical protein
MEPCRCMRLAAIQGLDLRKSRDSGIQQFLARSAQARGCTERAFGTIQGGCRRNSGITAFTDYDAAKRYLQRHFIADFNRFAVKPAQPKARSPNWGASSWSAGAVVFPMINDPVRGFVRPLHLRTILGCYLRYRSELLYRSCCEGAIYPFLL